MDLLDEVCTLCHFELLKNSIYIFFISGSLMIQFLYSKLRLIIQHFRRFYAKKIYHMGCITHIAIFEQFEIIQSRFLQLIHLYLFYLFIIFLMAL